MAELVLGGYLALTALHLFFCWNGNIRWRSVTKALLMPALLVYYLLAAPHVSVLVAAGIVFGWIGDVLLLKTGKGFFLGGLSSFLAGHLCYAAAIGSLLSDWAVQPWLAVLIPLLFAAIGFAAYRTLAGKVGEMKAPVLAYLAVILGMAAVAAFYAANGAGCSGALVCAGAIAFLVSDYLLAWQEFGAPIRHGTMAVMATYLAAQLLLVMGLRMVGVL